MKWCPFWLMLTLFGPFLTGIALGGDRPNPVNPTDPADPADPATTETPPSVVGWVELAGPLHEGPSPFTWGGEEVLGSSLRGVLGALEQVADDPRYAGVVIHLNEPDLTITQIEELGRAIAAVRETGHKVLVFSNHYDLRQYLLACSADLILLQHNGVLELAGLGLEEVYLAGLLEKLGVKADFLQIGQFKGANEPLTRTEPSPEWNQNIDALLDDLYAAILDRIARHRGLDRDQVEPLMAGSWTMSDEQYTEHGLVDRLCGRDLVEVTGQVFGDGFLWEDLAEDAAGRQDMGENPLALLRALFAEPGRQLDRPTVAVLHVRGVIHSGQSGDGGVMGEESAGSETLLNNLWEAQEDDHIAAVVLRIDSPGGSALASEAIWQAVRELGQVKPVFASIGDLGASGGYYIASAVDTIYVSPSTILGSIGVVGGKITLGGLYERIGIGVHRRSRGPMGDMFNSVEPFTREQRTALLAAFERTYEQFTDRVMIGRGDRIEDIDTVAHGRIFTGRQAVHNGLADQLGGIERVIADLAEAVGLEPGGYGVLHLPRPRSLPEVIEDMFQVSHTGPAFGWNPTLTQAARLALGPRGWQAAQSVLLGLRLLQTEPVLTLWPTAIVIR